MQNTHSRSNSIVTLFVIVALAMLVSFVGCSSPANSENEAEKEAPELVSVGEKSDQSVQIKVHNNTNKEIASLQIEKSGTVGLTDQELAIPSGDTFLINLNASEFADTATETTSDVIVRPVYDVVIGFTDGSHATTHGLGTEDVTEFTLLLSDEGILYVEYTTAEGSTESTLETEKALIAAAEAEALAQAEAEAAAQAAAEAATQTYDNYDYNYDYGAGSDNSDSVGQSEDQCVDDIVLR